MRATASASFLLINNLIGLGVGPMLIGALSELFKERLRHRGASLRRRQRRRLLPRRSGPDAAGGPASCARTGSKTIPLSRRS